MRRLRCGACFLVVSVLLALPGHPSGAVAPRSAANGVEVVSESVTIQVTNHNRTPLPCPASGASLPLQATLVGPAAAVEHPSAVTVYVHDFATAGWFWRFAEVPGFDFTGELAREGHVSLVIDRLGYAGSPLANGQRTCLGAQATMLHQVVGWVRTQLGADTVVLAGHSVGAAVAELEAATFRDVDGLVQMSWADAGESPRAVTEAVRQNLTCLLGGDRTVGRPGYAYYAPGDAAFREIMFHSAPADVQAAAAARRTADPCGDALSLASLVAVNQVLSHTVSAPVLLLFGEDDALNRPDAAALQRLAFAPGRATSHVLPDTGGALPLEASAPQTRALLAAWLCQRYTC